MVQMLQPCHLHDGAVGREVSGQADHASARRQRIVDGRMTFCFLLKVTF